jgi:hypothetical protein
MKYEIAATLKQELKITIEADSYEEALRIADYETIIDDWDVIGSEFKPERVILAEHKCSTFTLFETEPPDYWNRKINHKPMLEEIPF